MQSTVEWIDWNDREPFVDEALLVIFRHKGTGICHLQVGSIIGGPYWYDYEPVYWTPNVPLPQEIVDNNEKFTAKMQEAWDKYKKNKAGLPSGQRHKAHNLAREISSAVQIRLPLLG